MDITGYFVFFVGGCLTGGMLINIAWRRVYVERFGQETQDLHDRQVAYWRNGAVGEFPNR